MCAGIYALDRLAAASGMEISFIVPVSSKLLVIDAGIKAQRAQVLLLRRREFDAVVEEVAQEQWVDGGLAKRDWMARCGRWRVIGAVLPRDPPAAEFDAAHHWQLWCLLVGKSGS